MLSEVRRDCTPPREPRLGWLTDWPTASKANRANRSGPLRVLMCKYLWRQLNTTKDLAKLSRVLQPLKSPPVHLYLRADSSTQSQIVRVSLPEHALAPADGLEKRETSGVRLSATAAARHSNLQSSSGGDAFGCIAGGSQRARRYWCLCARLATPRERTPPSARLLSRLARACLMICHQN